MCGLIGVAGARANTMTLEERQALVQRLAHRGPDGHGTATSRGTQAYVLGHTRLAIQDTSTLSAQPFFEGAVVLTYNGELWNADAINVGVRRTTGDTEVVAKALSLYGEEALPRFDGMFALAWYDRDDHRIRLTRDKWGKVPLYVATSPDGQSIMWASEVKALEPGWAARAVPPGWVLAIDPDSGQVVDEHPWHRDNPMPWSLEPALVLELLRAGVAERLVGERSVGYMLSGGLDSSLILALACEEGADVVAYTAVMDPRSKDLAAARHVARYYGVELVEVPVPAPTEQSIREAIRTIEIPSKAQVEIALAHLPVMRAMRRDGHAVYLSGEAADELFGGYGGMQIKASKATDEEYRRIKLGAVTKMARGNFVRVNKVGMAYGIEGRLPFMQSELVELALLATKEESPPGKRLLKEAARGLVPDRIINRAKVTFQGGVGTQNATTSAVKTYNATARDLFGYLPKD